MTDGPEIVEDAGEVVDRFWPYDGPHSAESVASAAAALGWLVRYLNNATGPGNAARTLPYAASADRVISNLGHTVGLFPQLLGQLCEFLDHQAQVPTLYDDRRDRPGAGTAAELIDQLCGAHQTVLVLGEQLAAAARLSSHLGNDTEDPDREVSRWPPE